MYNICSKTRSTCSTFSEGKKLIFAHKSYQRKFNIDWSKIKPAILYHLIFIFRMPHQGVKMIFFPKSPILVLRVIWSYFFSPLKVSFIVNCLHLMCFFRQSSHSMLVHFKCTTLDKRKILSINHQLHTHPVHQIKVI